MQQEQSCRCGSSLRVHMQAINLRPTSDLQLAWPSCGGSPTEQRTATSRRTRGTLPLPNCPSPGPLPVLTLAWTPTAQALAALLHSTASDVCICFVLQSVDLKRDCKSRCSPAAHTSMCRTTCKHVKVQMCAGGRVHRPCSELSGCVELS